MIHGGDRRRRHNLLKLQSQTAYCANKRCPGCRYRRNDANRRARRKLRHQIRVMMARDFDPASQQWSSKRQIPF